MTSIKNIPARALDGSEYSLADHEGPLLIVNVASKCGLTPQYTALEQLAKDYGPKGLTVIGVPCNQFMGQEPGSSEEIAEFCSTTYGVTFPLLEKTEVNGENRHPLYEALTQTPDASGTSGDIEWNFEKFLVGADGAVVGRVRPVVEPQDAAVVERIEENLPA